MKEGIVGDKPKAHPSPVPVSIPLEAVTLQLLVARRHLVFTGWAGLPGSCDSQISVECFLHWNGIRSSQNVVGNKDDSREDQR